MTPEGKDRVLEATERGGALALGPGLGRGGAGVRVRAPGGAGGVAPMRPALTTHAPTGPLATAWERHRNELALIGPTRLKMRTSGWSYTWKLSSAG